MITNSLSVVIDSGIEYISQWRDSNGNYEIDKYVPYGSRYIVNKSVTGCGFTSYSLSNNENTILVSPRLRLIQNKLDQFNKKVYNCFYFNRERDDKGTSLMTMMQLENEFLVYSQQCCASGRPLKILVSYDSFSTLASMLENKFSYDISNDFRIVIDEAHSIIKDIKLKEYNNKTVLSSFLSRLFTYANLLFISATPIIEYLCCIDEFVNNDIYYVELQWRDAIQVINRPFSCKNATNAFDQIYKLWSSNDDGNGKHYFDVMHYAGNVSLYSDEAIIYLNSVLDIARILNKYVGKLNLIDPKDVSILCTNTKENRTKLRRVDNRLKIMRKIPEANEPVTRWLFVTRTCFEGVDFMHKSASTFVIANYNVESLSLDVASDLPQISGRLRDKSNPFRNIINIFYTNSNRVVDDEAFAEFQRMKMVKSQQQISIWQTAFPECKNAALTNLETVIDKDPNDLYLNTVNGVPEINPLIIISENYCRDILKNHKKWFVMSGQANVYTMMVSKLKDELASMTSPHLVRNRLKCVYGYYTDSKDIQDEIISMLCTEGYSDLARLYCQLPADRIKANSFDSWKIEQEIEMRSKVMDVGIVVASKFITGQTYTKKEVKSILQDVYDSLGLKMVAKATDLPNYIECSEVKRGGVRVILIG